MVAALVAFFKALPVLVKTGQWAYKELREHEREKRREEARRKADEDVERHF